MSVFPKKKKWSIPLSWFLLYQISKRQCYVQYCVNMKTVSSFGIDTPEIKVPHSTKKFTQNATEMSGKALKTCLTRKTHCS